MGRGGRGHDPAGVGLRCGGFTFLKTDGATNRVLGRVNAIYERSSAIVTSHMMVSANEGVRLKGDPMRTLVAAGAAPAWPGVAG